MNPAYALPSLTAVLTLAALLQGGYYPRQIQIVTAAAFTAWIASRPSRDAAPPSAAAAGFALLAAGLAAAAVAAGFPAVSLKPALTLATCVLVYLLAARVVARDGADAILDLIVAVATIVAVAGLIGVAFHLQTWAFQAGTWRLSSTLTYQNAAASLFALALPAALTRADRRWPRIASVALAAGLAATQSRGGAAAAVVAVAVVARLRPVPDPLRLALAAMIAAAAMIPAIVGVPFSAIVAVPGLAAAAAIAVARPHRDAPHAGAWWPAAAAVAAIVVVAVATTPISDRFSATANDRGRVWRATIDRIGEAPVLGTGPGTFAVSGIVDGAPVRTLHAHNEYLQVAAETGLAGLALVVAAIAMFAAALIRVRRADAAWVAAVAASSAFLIHSGLDFLWRIPLLPAAIFALLAAALTTERSAASP